MIAQQTVSTPEELLHNANAAYTARNYKEAIRLYQEALPSLDELVKPDAEYNLACSQALAGEANDALASLHEAVEGGYTDRAHMSTDTDLISLHQDPRWPSMLDEMLHVKAGQDSRWGDAAFATAYTPDLSEAGKLAGLAELWAQAKYGFANFWHVPNLNWDQTYIDFIPQVTATHSTAEYYKVLQRFYAQLQDGHSNVYSPDQMQGRVDGIPPRTRLVDGHVLIIGSWLEGADLQGLKPGDEIVTINGEPTIAWAQRNVAPYVSSSAPQDRDTRIYEYGLFQALVGTVFNLGTRTPAGVSQTHTFTVKPPSRVHRPQFALHQLPGGIVYVALNSFGDDTDATEWDVNWTEISHAKALVLDLRENGGGSDSVGAHILATLLDKPAQGALSRSTRWIATYRAWGVPETPKPFPVPTLQPDSTHHFTGPVVILTSPRTFSAGEDMVLVFHQAGRGEIVGEPTGGSSGQPLSFKLPGGGEARVCSKHDSFADGREFIGIGIVPDIPAHLTRDDIVNGHDSVRDAALRALNSGS